MNGFDKLFIYFCICRAQVEAKNINILVQVHKNVPIEIYGDRYRLEHVMNNLLSNAIKFSPDNSEICLSLSYETKVQHAVTFAVRDYGPGISNDDRQQLFQPFMQVRPGELQKGRGSGLGLSICKNMIELHRGTIGLSSVVRTKKEDITTGGTEFFFTVMNEQTSYAPPSDYDAVVERTSSSSSQALSSSSSSSSSQTLSSSTGSSLQDVSNAAISDHNRVQSRTCSHNNDNNNNDDDDNNVATDNDDNDDKISKRKRSSSRMIGIMSVELKGRFQEYTRKVNQKRSTKVLWEFRNLRTLPSSVDLLESNDNAVAAVTTTVTDDVITSAVADDDDDNTTTTAASTNDIWMVVNNDDDDDSSRCSKEMEEEKTSTTDIPSTDIPPTDIPPTDIPPTDIPPTEMSVLTVPAVEEEKNRFEINRILIVDGNDAKFL
jgi:hypothetical protein